MKYVALALGAGTLLLLTTTDILTDTIKKVKNNEKEYRTFPRIQKAENLIAKNNLTEAKKLLEEVIAIDPNNTKAARMLVNIALHEGDIKSAQRYAGKLTPAACADFYRGKIAFLRHDYTGAYKALYSLKNDTCLSKEEQFQKNLLLLKSAVLSHHEKDVKTLQKLFLHQHISELKQEYPDLISLLINNGMYDIAMEEISFFTQKTGETFDQQKILIWANLLRHKGRLQDAKALLGMAIDSKEKLDEELAIYLQEGEYPKAVETMENLYRLNPTPTNRQRLIYLYKKAGMDDRIQAMYEKAYARDHDSKTLEKILFMEKDNNKFFALLQKYYPFEGLSDDQKYQFSMRLIKEYEARKQRKEVLQILHDLEKLQDLDESQRFMIAYKYSKYKQHDKATEILEALYAEHPTQKYKKRLLYLYQKAKKEDAAAKLLLSERTHKCNATTITGLLNLKENDKIIERLRTYYPFDCLSKKRRFAAIVKLIEYYDAKGDTAQVRTLLKRTSRLQGLTNQQKLVLANWYHTYKMYHHAVTIAQSVLEKDPNNLEALKLVGYDNGILKQYGEAVYFLEKAHQLAPDDLQLLSSLGYLYAKLDLPKKALSYWDQYIAKTGSKAFMLKAAQLAYEHKLYDKAQAYLAQIETPPQKDAATYYSLKAKIAQRMHKPDEAIKAYRTALSYDGENIDNLYALAELYKKEKQDQLAVKTLKKMIPLVEDKAKYYAQIGYLEYQNAHYHEAAQAFDKAISYAPQEAEYHLAKGYSVQKEHRNKEAVASFKKYIDLTDDNSSQVYEVKRNILNLQKRWSGYAAMCLPLNKLDDDKITSPLYTDSAQGYASVRLNYIPDMLDDRFTLYANAAVGIRSRSLDVYDETFQPSVGVSYKVLRDQLLFASVEKLFKGGSQSRNDWMLRLSANFFDSYAFDPTVKEKWYHSLYTDGSWFANAQTYRLYANYEVGYLKKLNYENAILPYACTSVSINNDNDTKKVMRNYEAGMGISYLFWRNENKYKAHSVTGRVRLEARGSYAGNDENENRIELTNEILF